MPDITPVAVFDWYAATIDETALQVETELSRLLGAIPKRARGLHGYPNGTDFLRDGDTIAKMIWGGQQSPHVWASGVDARDLAAVLRQRWPKHYVTRVDVAYDFVDGEPWAELYAHSVAVADTLPNGQPRRRPLKLATLGDWVREEEGFPGGRTLYVGSMKSPVLVRLYEKGKQMRNLYPDQLDKYPEGWVRLELQVRPEGKARYEVATLEPSAIWGTSQWARALHQRVFGSSLSAVLMAAHRPSDDERAFRFLLRQYGPLLRRRAALLALDDTPASRLGAWSELGVQLGLALGAIEKTAATGFFVSEEIAQPRFDPLDDDQWRSRHGADVDFGPDGIQASKESRLKK